MGKIRKNAVPKEAEGDAGEEDPGMKELEDAERAERTLFVGNLSIKATRKMVKKLFAPYGIIESVRIRGAIAENPKLPKRVAVIAKRMAPQQDTYLAFVVFAKQDNLEAKLEKAKNELNLRMFKDKLLIVNAANYRRGRVKHSMFVGNLPFDATVEEVVKVFRAATADSGSHVTNVILHKTDYNLESAPTKGSGYVVFDDAIGVSTALNLQGEVQIRGRVLRMEPGSKSKRVKKERRKEERELEEKALRKEIRRAHREAGLSKGVRQAYGGKSSNERRRDRLRRGTPGITKKIRKAKSDKKLIKKLKAAEKKNRKSSRN